MRVVFLEDVAGVAQGGDVKEVKNGFARNYLIPQRLAMPATKDAMQRTRTLANDAEVNRLKTLADMRELSKELDGTQVNIEMRAGASGRLYGSVTNAIVADEIAKMTDREIDRRTIQIPEPIRQTGVYDLRVRLHAEVDAGISLVVFPVGADAEEFLASLHEQEEGEQEESAEGEAEVEDAAEEGVEEPPSEDTADEVGAPDEADEEAAEPDEPAAEA
jgi:large subunit ribosomal protein L9